MKNMDDLDTEEICKELNITPSNYWVMMPRAETDAAGVYGEKLVYGIMALKEKILMNCESASALVEKKRDKKLDFRSIWAMDTHGVLQVLCAFLQAK